MNILFSRKKVCSVSDDDYYNETSNTAAGINTPKNHEGVTASEPLDEFVKKVMDNIEHALYHHNEKKDSPEKDKKDSHAKDKK